VSALLGPTISAALCDCLAEQVSQAIDQTINDHDGEIAAAAFRKGLSCAIGDTYADFVLADLTGNAARSNAEFAAEHGITRAAISKILVRCRRNLGFPLRVPKNARAGAGAGAKAIRDAKAAAARNTAISV
jgi:hypothetical protein